MLSQRITAIAVAAAALVLDVWAGELVLGHEIQQDFKMALSPRQDQQTFVGPFRVGAGANLNIFNGALGNATSPPITHSSDPNHPFTSDGQNVSDFQTATNKACDAQKNACAQLANGLLKGKFEVSECDQQREQCIKTLGSATQKAFLEPATQPPNDQFDFLCEI